MGILADFPWWSMCLADRAAYIKMMADATKNICAHAHNHLSFRSCKLVCLNLYQDRASAGGIADSNLPWSREELDKTKNLLESLNDYLSFRFMKAKEQGISPYNACRKARSQF